MLDGIDLAVADGEVVLRGRRHRVGQEHPAAHRQRPGAPRHRRAVPGRGGGGRPRRRPPCGPATWPARWASSTRTPRPRWWWTRSSTTWPSCWRTWAWASPRCAAGSRRSSTPSGIAALRHRSPSTLSGGERQRCAVAGALAAAPAVLVLDEPTSMLDPQGADDVLAAVARLADDLGTTVVMAEHRLERAAPMADRAVVLGRGRIARRRRPRPGAGRRPGRPAGGPPGAAPRLGPAPAHGARGPPPGPHRPRRPRPALRRGRRPAPGEVLLADPQAWPWATPVARLCSPASTSTCARARWWPWSGATARGSRPCCGPWPTWPRPSPAPSTRQGRVALVPQDPSSLLFSPTVRAEVAETCRLLGRDPAAVDGWLARLALTALADRHPRSLSTGERQRVAVAAVAVGGAPVLLLDEPTRGIDATSRAALEAAATAHAAEGGAVVIATHDVELAARTATRVVALGGGEVVADGPARERAVRLALRPPGAAGPAPAPHRGRGGRGPARRRQPGGQPVSEHRPHPPRLRAGQRGRARRVPLPLLAPGRGRGGHRPRGRRPLPRRPGRRPRRGRGDGRDPGRHHERHRRGPARDALGHGRPAAPARPARRRAAACSSSCCWGRPPSGPGSGSCWACSPWP